MTKVPPQNYRVWNPMIKEWIPFGLNAAADYYDLINPNWETRETTALEAREIVQRYRDSRLPLASADLDTSDCLLAFDLRLQMPVRRAPKFAEFLTISLAGVEPMYESSEFDRLGLCRPETFTESSFGNNTFCVMNHGCGVIQIRGWELVEMFDGSFSGLERDLLKGFSVYLSNQGDSNRLIADETMLIADQSWVLTQAYSYSPDFEREAEHALSCKNARHANFFDSTQAIAPVACSKWPRAINGDRSLGQHALSGGSGALV